MRRFELLGLPGSGKTTLAKALPPDLGVLRWRGFMERERLRERPLRRHRLGMRLLPRAVKLRVLTGPAPDAKDAAWFVERNPAFHAAATDVCDAVADTDNRALARALLFETCAHYAFAERVARPGDGLLLDEGLWQRLAYPLAQAGPAGERLLPRLLDHAPPLDGLVVVDLPLDIAVQRVRARGKEFTQTEVMPGMDGWIRRITDGLRAAGLPVTVIGADRPVTDVLSDLVDVLRRWMD